MVKIDRDFSFSMPERERDSQGRFEERVKLEEVLKMFEEGVPLSATEVANEFDMSNRAALNKLQELQEQGLIERKQVGSRAVVWWKPPQE